MAFVTGGTHSVGQLAVVVTRRTAILEPCIGLKRRVGKLWVLGIQRGTKKELVALPADGTRSVHAVGKKEVCGRVSGQDEVAGLDMCHRFSVLPTYYLGT
jgi:hypothetical protein